MTEIADRLAGPLVGAEDALARVFEARLADSSALSFRVAYSVLRHRQDAEDVAQEAFVRAYRGFRHLRDRQRFRAWLVRTTWRLSLDRRRSDRRRQAREDREMAGTTGLTRPLEDDVIAGEQSARLWHAIDRLPEKLRVAVVLAAIEGHGVRDVASLLRVPQGTVKSRLFEARRRLQEMLR
jgi:RNA polymerase sigma-70 factor (ECF subfamily)